MIVEGEAPLAEHVVIRMTSQTSRPSLRKGGIRGHGGDDDGIPELDRDLPAASAKGIQPQIGLQNASGLLLDDAKMRCWRTNGGDTAGHHRPRLRSNCRRQHYRQPVATMTAFSPAGTPNGVGLLPLAGLVTVPFRVPMSNQAYSRPRRDHPLLLSLSHQIRSASCAGHCESVPVLDGEHSGVEDEYRWPHGSGRSETHGAEGIASPRQFRLMVQTLEVENPSIRAACSLAPRPRVLDRPSSTPQSTDIRRGHARRLGTCAGVDKS